MREGGRVGRHAMRAVRGNACHACSRSQFCLCHAPAMKGLRGHERATRTSRTAQRNMTTHTNRRYTETTIEHKQEAGGV